MLFDPPRAQLRGGLRKIKTLKRAHPTSEDVIRQAFLQELNNSFLRGFVETMLEHLIE